MRKIVIHKPGDYRRLEIQEQNDLKAGDGEVVVDIECSGVNYADVLVRWGVYESAKKLVGWPITPGFEFSGTVREFGAGVSGFKIGQKVFGVTLFNAYATQVKVPAHQLFAIPQGFTMAEAAAFPSVFMTAYHALFQNAYIRPQGLILVHSAAGGVGSAVLQVAKIAGFKTIAVVGSSHKVQVAKNFGATWVIDKSTQNLWREVEKIAPHGLDAVLDANGVSTLKQGYDHLAPTGKLICYGFHSMLPKEGGRLQYGKLAWDFIRTPRFNPLNLCTDNKSVIAFNISFLFDRYDLLNQAMGDLFKWIAEGKIKPPQVTCYPFEEVARAHQDIESGKTVGKLVLETHSKNQETRLAS